MPRSTPAIAWLLATSMCFFGEAAMARSLLLAEPSQLAGVWRAVLAGPQENANTQALQDKPSNICVIELKADQSLGGQTDCLGRWLGDEPVHWFPEPDGLSLIGKQNTRTHLGRHETDRYQMTLESGSRLLLERDIQENAR
ncbi:alkaline proteinase inhibitor [Pseudomonas sp. AF32]|nr:alkaline proteinase inhibitor [Pseudomonas sp. AF32]